MQRFVYFAVAAGRTKIGLSLAPQRRVNDLQIGSPVPLVMVGFIPGTHRTEQLIHREYAEHRLHGEWFDFEATPEMIAEIEAWLANRKPVKDPPPKNTPVSHATSLEEAVAKGLPFWTEMRGTMKVSHPVDSAS